jgi:hypothetical protein
MNTTLTLILAALLAGAAASSYPEAQELVTQQMSAHHATQVAQAEALADTYGLDLTGEAAFAHFYDVGSPE